MLFRSTSHYAGDPASLAWAVLRVLRDHEGAEKLKEKAAKRLATDFDWGHIADQTIQVYEQVWKEFLASYWADRTLWPITPGAEERAAMLKVQDKAKSGAYVPRPMPNVSVPNIKIDPDSTLASGTTKEEETEEEELSEPTSKNLPS